MTMTINLPDELYPESIVTHLANIHPKEQLFFELLDKVKSDMLNIRTIIHDNFSYFKPFIRGNNIDEILDIISEIIGDATELQQLKLKCCKFDKDCKRKECCAYIHYLDFEQIIKPMTFLHDNTDRFIEDKCFSYSSAIIRNLYFIHNAIWNSLSRRTFGLKQVILR